MEPGKIPHEIRHGELAQLGILPFHAVLRDARRHEPVRDRRCPTSTTGSATRACSAATCPTPRRRCAGSTRHGDRDGDGFQEYATRSSPRLLQPGLEGRRRRDPSTTTGRSRRCRSRSCELQGYAYDAKLRLARHLRRRWAARGRARGCGARRRRLYERVNDRVLVGGGGDVLPGPRRATSGRSESVASNAGHLPALAGSCRPTGRRASAEAADGRRHVVGLGHPDAVVGPSRATTRSATTRASVWPAARSRPGPGAQPDPEPAMLGQTGPGRPGIRCRRSPEIVPCSWNDLDSAWTTASRRT